jgi:hypothetical protein
MMVVYEIHTYRDGTWKIDSIFDDRDLAVLEAHRMERALRYSGVRVIEETYDEATDKTVTRTIYRSSKADKHNAAAMQRRAESMVLSAETRPSRRSGNGAAVAARRPPSISRILLVATLTCGAILFCSLGAIYALNALTR